MGQEIASSHFTSSDFEHFSHQLELETQLKLFQARINPHFLFNSLNSIKELGRKKNPKQLDKIVQWNLLITGPKAEGMLNLERAIPLMADGRMNLKPLITHTFSLDDINEAFDTFTGRVGGAIKVIVQP